MIDYFRRRDTDWFSKDRGSNSMKDTDERQGSTSFPWPSRMIRTRGGGLFHDCPFPDETAESDYQIVWFDLDTQR